MKILLGSSFGFVISVFPKIVLVSDIFEVFVQIPQCAPPFPAFWLLGDLLRFVSSRKHGLDVLGQLLLDIDAHFSLSYVILGESWHAVVVVQLVRVEETNPSAHLRWLYLRGPRIYRGRCFIALAQIVCSGTAGSEG